MPCCAALLVDASSVETTKQLRDFHVNCERLFIEAAQDNLKSNVQRVMECDGHGAGGLDWHADAA